MTCDHDTTRSSLPAFLQATTFLGFVIFPDEVQAQGRCNGCDSTLAVSVALARGQAVSGTIATDDPPAVRFAGKVARHLEDLPEETPEEHAARVIT